MTYKEDIIFEKAFLDFLLKYKKRKENRFQYYKLGKNKIYDCSFLGYYINDGIHGLHFNRKLVTYYFGQRNPSHEVKPFTLPYGLAFKIPTIFRDALLYSANNRRNVLVKDNKIIDIITGNIVS